MAHFEKDITRHADPAKARILARFFKTGPGEYGEGDVFLGITVPESRRIAREHKDASLAEVRSLLASKYHEVRLIALLILIDKYDRGGEAEQRRIVDLYLAHTRHINNWDLVDLSAPNVIGNHVLRNGDRKLLWRLARSGRLWEERIAIVATHAFIRAGDASLTYELAEYFLSHRHDLIHKATGWMLREAGKRVSEPELRTFLDRYAPRMPRTMLRYAIERLPEKVRRQYLGPARTSGQSRTARKAFGRYD